MSPRSHKFTYNVAMLCLNLNELDIVASKIHFFSVDKFNIISFKRRDYMSASDVVKKLQNSGFIYTANNIFILTNPSFFGFCYNPVSFYYCLDSKNDKVEYILAEINNTPWNERYVYCFDCRASKRLTKVVFDKKFHVSPFMPMNVKYNAYFYHSENKIIVVLRDFEKNNMIFSAALQLRRSDLNNYLAIKYILKYFMITQKTLFRIYWHALKLWKKRIPFYSHPGGNNG